ncbi:MAG: hypothetical protein WKF43_10535 [Acidimicrobiales bacterium]
MNTAAPWRRALMSVAWTAGVVASLMVLQRLGSGDLSAPPVTDRDRLQVWMEQRGAITAAFALLRLVAVVVAWYLLAATIVGLLARASRVPGLVTLADAATVPALRRLFGAVAGLGLTASAATLVINSTHVENRTAAMTDEGWAAQAALVIERLPDGSSLVIERHPDDDDDGGNGTATMRVLGAPAATPPPTAAWTTAAGDHLWHIAEATLAEAWGRPPTDTEVLPYWQSVVEANRSRLADRANPDLIYPGQVFDLPAPPAPPAPPG